MQKRRALVLVDEAAGHPFLRSLAPHVRSAGRNDVRWETLAKDSARARWRIGYADLRDFLMAYCATFVAVTAFIS